LSSAPKVIHITTTDISLELLLGPQLEAFVDAGYEVVGASAPGPFVGAIESRGVRFVPLEHSTRSMALTSDIRAMREVYRLFRHEQPDIVHTHNPKPGVYGRIAAKAARVPVIVNTVHGLYASPDDSWAKRAVVYSLERVAATCSDAELVQNSEDLARLRRLRVPRSRLHHLGNGVDLGRFQASDDSAAIRARVRQELGVDDNTVVVGAVGRLVWEKGYRELLDAAIELRSRYPEARLVIVGPHEPDKADAVDSHSREAAERAGVIFLGHRDDVHELYHGFDIYVLASHREGFPRSAMEAAAAGLPLVLTDIRGCREVVDHDITGLLVPVRDAKAIADALASLVADADLRSRLGSSAAERAVAEFDQQSQIDLTLATYEQLLAR
jgi:glycosyltransferase involved in cell wall biosynthesis